jgi:hypothetical protein
MFIEDHSRPPRRPSKRSDGLGCACRLLERQRQRAGKAGWH